MKLVFKILLILPPLFLSSLLVSCNQKPARVTNHHHKFYSKNSSHNQNKYRSGRYGSNAQADGFLKVEPGDTLYGVARKNNINLRDLIEINNLKAPYNLMAGSKLQVPSANKQHHMVKDGETLYEISRHYNIKMDSLISLNGLKDPYVLRPGQDLLISASARKDGIHKPKKAHKKPTSTFREKVMAKIGRRSGKFSWPIKGRIISNFGPKSGGLYNDGINIKADRGSPVKAAENGVVAYVGNELKGYGNLVIIKHSGGYITAYAHLEKFTVKRGERVAKGEEVGAVGSSGNVSSPQLYFGLRKGRDAINPKKYLSKRY